MFVDLFMSFVGYSVNGASDLPNQAWGVYFGWVEVDSQQRFKIIVSIKWDYTSGSFGKTIVRFQTIAYIK